MLHDPSRWLTANSIHYVPRAPAFSYSYSCSYSYSRKAGANAMTEDGIFDDDYAHDHERTCGCDLKEMANGSGDKGIGFRAWSGGAGYAIVAIDV